MTHHNTLVLAASGKTGRRLVPRLRLRGIPVRAASRSSQTPFDWSDPASWDTALRDVTALYLVAPRDPGPVRDFVSLAQERGVRRLVLLSGRGADTWGNSSFGLDMRAGEEAVRSSTLEWTILRPNNFAQNFDEDIFHAALVAGELALPSTKPEPLIDVEDVADAAALVLSEPGRHGGQTYELTGPRSITFAEAVELISQTSGRCITYKQTSAEEFVADLQAQGVSDEDAHHVAEMFALMERGAIASTTGGVANLLGRPPRTFEDYAVRAAAAGAWTR